MSFYQDRYITFNDQSSLGWFFILNKEEQLMSKTVNTQDIPNSAGVKVKNVKHNSKIIKLKIMFTMEQIKTSEIYSIHDFKRFIASFFDTDKEAKFIDSKDPNVYQNVIFQGTSDIQFMGNNTAITEIELLNPFGLSYATTLKEFTASLNSKGVLEAVVDSRGTGESIVDFEITSKSDNGYWGIVSENGLMEFGKRNEVDGVIAEKSVELTSNKNANFSNWIDGTVFYENQGKKVSTKLNSIQGYGLGVLTENFTNTQNGSWYGGVKEKRFSETSKNWYLWAQAWFEAGLMGQTGAWCIAIIDKNNHLIAGMAIEKSDSVGNRAYVSFLVGDNKGGSRVIKTIDFTSSYWKKDNPYGSESKNANLNPFDIKKEGANIRFFWNGGYYNYVVPEVENTEANLVQFFSGQFGSRTTSLSQRVNHSYIDNLIFVKMNVKYWKDIPNRYKNGDVLKIKGESRTPFLNEMPRFEDQLKGTEYFRLKQGMNKIQFYYSDFAKQPDVKIYLREVFI